MRLSSRALSDLPGTVRRPAYERDRLAVGMAHIGVGAFHRCHQAEFTDDMLEAEFGPWGVVGHGAFPRGPYRVARGAGGGLAGRLAVGRRGG